MAIEIISWTKIGPGKWMGSIGTGARFVVEKDGGNWRVTDAGREIGIRKQLQVAQGLCENIAIIEGARAAKDEPTTEQVLLAALKRLLEVSETQGDDGLAPSGKRWAIEAREAARVAIAKAEGK